METEVTQCCRNCTMNLPLKAFREYPGEQQGHYKVCLKCQSLETRYRYLRKQEQRQAAWLDENPQEEEITQEQLNKLSGINANPAEIQQIVDIWEMYLQVGGNPVLLKDHTNRDASITQTEYERALVIYNRRKESEDDNM